MPEDAETQIAAPVEGNAADEAGVGAALTKERTPPEVPAEGQLETTPDDTSAADDAVYKKRYADSTREFQRFKQESESKVAELESRLAEREQERDLFSAQPPAVPSAPGQGQVPPLPNGELTPELERLAFENPAKFTAAYVADREQRMRQEWQQQIQLDATRRKFDEAIASNPEFDELADKNSDLYRMATGFVRATPPEILHREPRMPYLCAMAAKALILMRKQSRDENERTRAARQKNQVGRGGADTSAGGPALDEADEQAIKSFPAEERGKMRAWLIKRRAAERQGV